MTGIESSEGWGINGDMVSGHLNLFHLKIASPVMPHQYFLSLERVQTT